MKKYILIIALFCAAISVNAQQVSSRAKAVRMLAYARPEYQVKDVKVYADTMTVFSLADYPILSENGALLSSSSPTISYNGIAKVATSRFMTL